MRRRGGGLQNTNPGHAWIEPEFQESLYVPE